MVEKPRTSLFGQLSPAEVFGTPVHDWVASGDVHATDLDGHTPPYKQEGRSNIPEWVYAFFGRSGANCSRRPPSCKEYFEPDMRIIERQLDRELKEKDVEIKKLELQIQVQRGENARIEVKVKEADVVLLQLKAAHQGGIYMYASQQQLEKETELAVQKQRTLSAEAQGAEQVTRLHLLVAELRATLE